MYQTKPRRALLSFLKSHASEPMSAAQIAQALQENVSESTVFRLLGKLTEEGALRAFPREDGRGYVYQYHESTDCHKHLHLKCRLCGSFDHLECERSDELLSHILSHHGFLVEPGISTLYGVCRTCRSKLYEKEATL